mgnify:CR=1 FL=1
MLEVLLLVLLHRLLGQLYPLLHEVAVPAVKGSSGEEEEERGASGGRAEGAGAGGGAAAAGAALRSHSHVGPLSTRAASPLPRPEPASAQQARRSPDTGRSAQLQPQHRRVAAVVCRISVARGAAYATARSSLDAVCGPQITGVRCNVQRRRTESVQLLWSLKESAAGGLRSGLPPPSIACSPLHSFPPAGHPAVS